MEALFRDGDVLLGRFRIIRPIGRGGMGEVYEAVDLELGRIALKTIRHGTAISADVLDRFRREVQLARRVTGAQICRIHELFLVPASNIRPATSFLTMEYLDGMTLSQRLRNGGPLPWKEALPIAIDICNGLRLIHEKGIIHRDLKCGNIMLCGKAKSARVVLMDFGLAHDFAPTDNAISGAVPFAGDMQTQLGRVVGTPAYMAPEQFEGGTVTPATDIYALGIVLYELVTGVRPFEGHSPLEAASRRAKRPAPPSSIGVRVPKHWDRVITKCLEYEPTKRFSSADEVRKALAAGPGNIDNLRKDRPWIFRSMVLLPAVAALWVMASWWQVTHYQRPNAEAGFYYKSGLAALRDGTYVRATRSFQDAIEKDPHFATGHVMLAEALFNLDFDGDSQGEMLLAMEEKHNLAPLDRMHLEAVHAMIDRNRDGSIMLHQKLVDKLRGPEKASAYVDLGLAYERAGLPLQALNCYKNAVQVDGNSPAPFLRTAILQSRMHKAAEADKAFSRAEALLTTQDSREGLAEFKYERAYAYNDAGEPARADLLLKEAFEEAKGLGSVPLQIRVLTQRSSAAYTSGRNEQAAEFARQAIDLAQNNGLQAWAAMGWSRLASAKIAEEDLAGAEEPLREALQLAHKSGQLRALALANITLASLMDQKHEPEKVIAPAQEARDYYSQNGFVRPAARASLLLVRALTGRGDYATALEAGKTSMEIASKSGDHDLLMLSEEALGDVYLHVENYPEALSHFQKADGFADSGSGKVYQDIHCADVLWRLGRYTESEALLNEVPANGANAVSLQKTRLKSMLSQGLYPRVLGLAEEALRGKALDDDEKQEIAIERALAEVHLGQRKQGLKDLDDAGRFVKAGTVGDEWSRRLYVVETDAYGGRFQRAYAAAGDAANHFETTGQLDSELRSVLLMALAAKDLNDATIYSDSRKKVVDIMRHLEQTWGSETYQTYLSRPDEMRLMREIGIPPAGVRR